MAPERARRPDAVDGGRGRDDDSPIEASSSRPTPTGSGEVLRHREFDRMTPAELREAERLVDLLDPRLELRRTRRYELHRHGRRLAPRAMFRRNLGTGGQLVSGSGAGRSASRARSSSSATSRGRWSATRGCCCGSSRRYPPRREVRTESFVFGTRLTRVTRLLRDRDRDRALARVSDAVNDWAGGTRIGESFRSSTSTGRAGRCGRRGVVIVVSDGWDRGDPALVADRDGPTAAQLPSADLAQPAGGHARLPAAGRRDARGLPLHRRLPARRHRRQPRTTRRDPGGVRAGDTRGGSEARPTRRSGARRVGPSSAATPSVVGGDADRPDRARPLR